MSEPFLGQIEIFSFNFPPKNWVFCAGQILPISQYAALFSLLGTTFGGNGQTTFALPDLRGRTPLGSGQGPGLQDYTLGQVAGEEGHILSINEMAAHGHFVNVDAATPGSSNGNTPASNTVLGQSAGQVGGGGPFPVSQYQAATAGNGALAPQSVAPAGTSQPHENRMPYLAINFCIALNGIFPSRN